MKTQGQLKARARENAKRKALTGFRHMVDNRQARRFEPPREPCPIKCHTCWDQPWRREAICEECGLPYEAERLQQA